MQKIRNFKFEKNHKIKNKPLLMTLHNLKLIVDIKRNV